VKHYSEKRIKVHSVAESQIHRITTPTYSDHNIEKLFEGLCRFISKEYLEYKYHDYDDDKEEMSSFSTVKRYNISNNIYIVGYGVEVLHGHTDCCMTSDWMLHIPLYIDQGFLHLPDPEQLEIDLGEKVFMFHRIQEVLKEKARVIESRKEPNNTHKHDRYRVEDIKY